jgi:phytoene dehydrogenase-like protein
VAEYDAVFVGSGVNSLACGALLAKSGWRVCVLERNDWLGGAICTAELTQPGYHHDVFSAWHPLWVGGAAHAELGDDLAARGLEYLNTELPTATAFPDGSAAFLLRNADGNAAELGPEWPDVLARFLPNADIAFGLLGTELWSLAGLALATRAYRRLGRSGVAAFTGELLQSSRDWLQQTFESERAHGVLAPWVLHTGLGPDAASSGFMTQVIAVAVQEGGMPIPRGGGARLADALVRLIRDHGGACETGKDVERVVVRSGRAAAVRLTGGETVEAGRAVIANVTPTQLYERLLDGDGPEPARRFRYGRAEMQIHFALSEPARWDGDERLNGTAIVHVTPGLDGV